MGQEYKRRKVFFVHTPSSSILHGAPVEAVRGLGTANGGGGKLGLSGFSLRCRLGSRASRSPAFVLCQLLCRSCLAPPKAAENTESASERERESASERAREEDKESGTLPETLKRFLFIFLFAQQERWLHRKVQRGSRREARARV